MLFWHINCKSLYPNDRCFYSNDIWTTVYVQDNVCIRMRYVPSAQHNCSFGINHVLPYFFGILTRSYYGHFIYITIIVSYLSYVTSPQLSPYSSLVAVLTFSLLGVVRLTGEALWYGGHCMWGWGVVTACRRDEISWWLNFLWHRC